MNHTISSQWGLGPRTPKMVGRQEEVERLQSFLRARGDRHFIYYWAIGGLGKTRLLEEVQRLVEEAAEEVGPGFYSTGIIDLYHTDTHSSSDVERAIVDGLDPKGKYFASYRHERALFERLRERGADPGVLEKHREQLSELFIKDCRQMALDARKLIICFDTVELLQYESSVVEEKAGSGTVDTRIRTWLLEKLNPLANVLVIFAGRPKAHSHEETIDHQNRLVHDMEAAFGKDLTVVELQPFTLPETEDFIHVLTKGQEVIPPENIPIVHKLTGGRPIFLHLVVDLVQVLALELSRVLELFDKYQELVTVPKDDERLREARDEIEVEILRALVNEGGDRGEYLCRIALMPKGVDTEMLQQVLGLPQQEAARLILDLAPLSFVKRFKAPPGAERLHSDRIFLHDEMYRLLTNPKVIPRLRISERQVAKNLITGYYDPHIDELEDEITLSSPDERIVLRERLQKLQVERLYYLLVQDPRLGYEEYKKLTDQANRRRWVGFSMRLLDEFLRYYNVEARRKLFAVAGISYEQVIRESTQMWVERFDWWAQYEREIQFAEMVLNQPDIFYIHPDNHLATLGNICALWVHARAVRQGYEPKVVEKAQKMLNRLPPLANCNSQQTLARARLSYGIGFQFHLGGRLTQAAEQYGEAKAAFRKLPGYQDELAILLHTLAFVHAKQGRMTLARPLAHEALRINEAVGSEYSTALTLSTLAKIAWMQGKHSQALRYGEEALALFRELEDSHGTVLAYLGIAQARRRMAKQEFHIGWRLEDARRTLEDARRDLDNALKVAEDAGLGSDLPVIHSEQGRVYRELGHVVNRLEGHKKGLVYYRQSERQLQQALAASEWGVIDRANTLQDLAEVLFVSRDEVGAQKCLEEIEDLIGSEYRIVPGEQAPSKDLPHEHFAPLGKVEMTRGQMAFETEQYEQGLQHYLLAYAYFMRFSPDAVEKEIMTEYLYNHLSTVDRKEELAEAVRAWAQQFDPNMGVNTFLKTLESLLGV